jgi:hypothetical protein
MVNLRAGAASLIQWIRLERAAASVARASDRLGLIRELEARRPDLARLRQTIAEQGVVAVPGYWSAERCAEARQAFDRVLTDNPASIQAYSGGSDERLYGMESADPRFADFHHDPFLKGFGELDGGLELYNFATLGGRITASQGNTGSGDGWHRDAHGYQFKAILYLSDTAPENGPFQYLIGSHKRWRVAFDTALGDLPEAPQTRYDNASIDKIAQRLGLTLQSFPAPAGTLLLVNTAGIHRGMPLTSARRYALTNYYYHPAHVDEARIAQFSPLLPGTAERVRRDLDLRPGKPAP